MAAEDDRAARCEMRAPVLLAAFMGFAGVLLVLLSHATVGPPLPTWWALGLAVLAGLLGNLGIQLLARAYAEAEAQALGVLEFTGLPWAALFGWLFFDEAVRRQVWLGALVIFAACCGLDEPTEGCRQSCRRLNSRWRSPLPIGVGRLVTTRLR